jgi:hypothetical protein
MGTQPRRADETSLLVASSDFVALDAVYAYLMGHDPMELEPIRLAHERGLGIGDIRQIEIAGDVDLDKARWSSRIGEGSVNQWQQMYPQSPSQILEHSQEREPSTRIGDVQGSMYKPITAGAEEAAGTEPVPLEGPQRRLSPPLAPQVVAPTGPVGSRWALLVGVNQYVDPTFPDLKFCVDDVLALDRMLESQGYTVIAMHDAVAKPYLIPSRDNVEAELARLCEVAEPDDLLWVHFACHGRLVDGRPLLVTHETRRPTLAERALPLAEVERRMRESSARRLVLTLDACHTGVEIGREIADPEFIRNAYELAEGFALLAASTAQQVAQEWEENRHGVFTYYLLEGLSGRADRDDKGFVTVDDLKNHVLDSLRRWNVQHSGLLQEPTARTEGLGDMILADCRRE